MSQRWRKFNFREWRSDEKLRRCSRDVQAIWLDLCGLIYEAGDMGRLSVTDDGQRRPYTRTELCKITGDDWRVMDRAITELVKHGVCDLEAGYLVSRRIAREEQKALQDASNGAKGGNPSLVDKALAQNGVNPQKPDFQKPEPQIEVSGVGFREREFEGVEFAMPTTEEGWDQFSKQVCGWANGSLSAQAVPTEIVLKPILQLMKPPSGEPCILNDVYVGIAKTAAQLHKAGKQVTTLGYFKNPILQARDERLKPNPAPEIHHERAGQSQSGRPANGKNGPSPRSGQQHGNDALVAAAMRRRGDREAQDDLLIGFDGGIDRVA